MAMNIKDPEAERLASEVAALTGESKTAAVREALRARRDQLVAERDAKRRGEEFVRFLEEEIWPHISPENRGKPITKAEREEILGYGPDGV
ncbi:type II toxin-antitoxin system VapB family antitoxin [Amycolatopsis anabasis]|uniref:type II toxin-antitoxin system VapB family antitoxin n=1 Tax=Amycolatopsis anabasis TaxID=1840409 RepID=UPI00131C3304|nr:type II toxin-antitoxin system VapB family antitoxin [Amycolatopsis anabasis]